MGFHFVSCSQMSMAEVKSSGSWHCGQSGTVVVEIRCRSKSVNFALPQSLPIHAVLPPTPIAVVRQPVVHLVLPPEPRDLTSKLDFDVSI